MRLNALRLRLPLIMALCGWLLLARAQDPGSAAVPTTAPAAAPTAAPIAAASAAPPATGAPVSAGSVYNIEILVFRETVAHGGAENWSSEGAGANFIGEEDTAGSGPQSVRLVGLLPASAFQLGGLEARLRAAGGYVPVAHAAWSQTASAWGTHTGLPLQRLGVEVPGLSGTVYLERGQYLHLGLALSWAMQSPPTGIGAAPGTVFTLNENRRVRFYDRNYYDHPAFGVIALVTPSQGGRAPGR